jgi:predicted Zn-dependent protease with MMP-like domain
MGDEEFQFPPWRELVQLARAEVEATLASLPAELRDAARRLPVTYEQTPGAELVADGIAEDTLGLFVGPPFADESATPSPIPAQIILYLDNLWDFADGDAGIFREELRTTLLHELGHYLGLDEDELTDRGLE